MRVLVAAVIICFGLLVTPGFSQDAPLALDILDFDSSGDVSKLESRAS